MEAVLAALLVATSFVGSLAGLSSVLKYNERSKINTRSRLTLAS